MTPWPTDAPTFGDALDEIVYASRLVGSDPSLVLAGGGNTSVKDTVTDVLGDATDVIFVKGSGWDLASIERAGFTALRRDRLRRILATQAMTDAEMMNELRQARLNSAAPDPSVEALLHAHLPGRVVIHTHADAMVAVMNQPNGRENAERLFGEQAVIVPYVMPGFDLARLVLESWLEGQSKRALVLMNHGLFTFGDTAAEAYDLHIELVRQAAESVGLSAVDAEASGHPFAPIDECTRREIASLRRRVSDLAGHAMLTRISPSTKARAFAAADSVAELAGRGPATPDHVIRTKRLPLIGRDLDRYATEYGAYFSTLHQRRGQQLTQLDAAPRVILDPEWGLIVAGRSAGDLVNAENIYLHTIDVIHAAESQSGYQALPAGDIFDVEYWELEQAKLRTSAKPRRFSGEVALVTGAASGIGRAIANAFLADGAAVVGLDLNPAVSDVFDSDSWLGLQGDVADVEFLETALSQAVATFGGIDILVPAAGIFAASAPIAASDPSAWARSLRVNTTAVYELLRLAHPLLNQAPAGGRVLLVASKNVAAPGPGAVAYSASKAAAAQVARVAALEWAADGIRVNSVHPDAVFDTALWTPELLAERAAKYGVTVEEYKRRNLLRREITSADVANAVTELCSPQFAATTGAQVAVDGGNDRVI